MAVTALLDVNVLIALGWSNHLHHHLVRSCFKLQRRAGWATCPLTEAGFVRVACNPSAAHYSVTPRDAIALLVRLTRLERHRFWPLERSMVDLEPEIVDRIEGYRQVRDGLLLSVAMQHGGQLATLDERLARIHPSASDGSVSLIPIE